MVKRTMTVLIFILFLSACSSEPATSEKKIEKEEDNVEQAEVTSLENEQDTVKNYFEDMITAANENNKTNFLSFQDETNSLFYKEQEVWLQDIDQKRAEGWNVSILIHDITLESMNSGTLTLQINMKLEDQDISNHITYPIHKVNTTWKLSDLPFKKMTDGPINLYYLPSLENEAKVALEDVKNLVNLYSQLFQWKPKEINIKLYDSVEEFLPQQVGRLCTESVYHLPR